MVVAVDHRQRRVGLGAPRHHRLRLTAVVHGEDGGRFGQRREAGRQLPRLGLERRDVRVDGRIVGERVAHAVHGDAAHVGVRVLEHDVARLREHLHRRRVLVIAADHDHGGAGRREPVDEQLRLEPRPDVGHVAGQQDGVDRRPIPLREARGKARAVCVHVHVADDEQPRDMLARLVRPGGRELRGDDLEAIDVGLETLHAATLRRLQAPDQRQQPGHVFGEAAVLDIGRLIHGGEHGAGGEPGERGRGSQPEHRADGQVLPPAPDSAGDQRARRRPKQQKRRETTPEEARERVPGALLGGRQLLDDLLRFPQRRHVARHAVVHDHVDGSAVSAQGQHPGRAEGKHQAASGPGGIQREVDGARWDAVAGRREQGHTGDNDERDQSRRQREPQRAPPAPLAPVARRRRGIHDSIVGPPQAGAERDPAVVMWRLRRRRRQPGAGRRRVAALRRRCYTFASAGAAGAPSVGV